MAKKDRKVLNAVLGTTISLGTLIGGGKLMSKEPSNNKNNIQSMAERINEKLVATNVDRSMAKMKKVKGKLLRVKATAYCNDPITSTGTVPKEGRTIAVDPKVIPYGTKVYIPQFDKVFIAEDCGSAIKGNRIDIFMNSYNSCMEWGIKEIDIYILD